MTPVDFIYSVFNKIRRDMHLAAFRRRNGTDDPKEIFNFYYERNLFGDSESLSGTGSSVAATETLRAALPRLLKEYEVGRLFDVPCGDFNWAKEIDWGRTRYMGADIVPGPVAQNRDRYGNDAREFVTLDVLTDKLPDCDLVLCRDLFIHFPNASVRTALKNIKNSSARYLLTTHYTRVTANRDIKLGSFRPLNLELPPFNLPVPQQIIRDDDYLKSWGRTMALWRVEDLP
ncbi:MAG: class I SAM-dependent methyltransferase [Rhodospirillaceae bacterium]|nr:class I SAM-dependent methyltransferase [Rhodospirillaceae bacterium]